MFLQSNFVPCRTATIEYTTIENVMTKNGLEKWPTRSVLACIKGTFTDTRYEKASKTVLDLKRKTEAGSTVTAKSNEEIFEN